jgi:N-acetylneuraminate lyase
MDPLTGIFPALITPFDEQGQVAHGPLARLLERVYAAGVQGVYVCGTTGEGLLQSVASRREVVDVVVGNTPRDRVVIVHVGAAAFDDVRELTRHATRAGAHAISSLPPSGVGVGFNDARRYYEALATCSDLPLVVYYFPDAYDSISSAAHLIDLCALPNVVGVKFTDFDLATLAATAATGCPVLNGRDEVLAAGLLMGARGGVGSFYNLMPERFVRLHALALAGRWGEARTEQEAINQVISAVLRFPLFPAIKQVLTWSGIPCGTCLLPRAPLTSEQLRELRVAVDESFMFTDG